ncbi:MAG: ABC transporter substrate-binding protein, partial [Nitriliruptoraceae bacterium]
MRRALIPTALLALLLAACGGGVDPAADGGATPGASDGASTAEPAPAPGSAAALARWPGCDAVLAG